MTGESTLCSGILAAWKKLFRRPPCFMLLDTTTPFTPSKFSNGEISATTYCQTAERNLHGEYADTDRRSLNLSEILNQRSSPLLSLPAEILNLIYRFVGQQEFAESHLPMTHRLPGANFLRTCKQVYVQAHHYIYQGAIAYAYEPSYYQLYWDELLPETHLESIDIIIQSSVPERKPTLPRAPPDGFYEQLYKAQFRPTTLILIGDFTSHDCPEHSVNPAESHQEVFKMYILNLHHNLTLLPSIDTIHFVDLNHSRLPEKLRGELPGCRWCSEHASTSRILPRSSGLVGFEKLSCAEMLECEYERRPQHEHYLERFLYTIEKCTVDVAYDYWLHVKSKLGSLNNGMRINVPDPHERIGVYIYDDWASFCKGWNSGNFSRQN
jgi:hypothetical protein